VAVPCPVFKMRVEMKNRLFILGWMIIASMLFGCTSVDDAHSKKESKDAQINKADRAQDELSGSTGKKSSDE
jgi:hypothetical protein